MDVLTMRDCGAVRAWASTKARGCARAIATPLIVGALLASHAWAAAPNAAVEYAVKAAYLSKFPLFVEWPASAFASPTSAVTLCISGMDPFGDTLDKVVEGQRVGERPLVIRRMEVVMANSGCHILYAGGSEAQSVAQALDVVNGTAVLTVTDATRRANAAGIIDFVIANGRVRFNADDQTASTNGVVISSHLLSLALSVKPRTEQGR